MGIVEGSRSSRLTGADVELQVSRTALENQTATCAAGLALSLRACMLLPGATQ